MFRLAVASIALIASPALAHPKLLAATPAADAAVAAPTRIELRFSERLMPKLSGATLMMTGMAGKSHDPMPIPGVTTTVGADGRSLVLTSPKPLFGGSYSVDWHVVAADTHRITGRHSFTVR